MHGYHSRIIFVDLVKAYNTVNHNMLWQLLVKFIAPKQMINSLNACIRIQVFAPNGDELRSMEYGNVVKEGDPIAGVLSIFVAQAAIELTEKHSETKEKITFIASPNSSGSLSLMKKPKQSNRNEFT